MGLDDDATAIADDLRAAGEQCDGVAADADVAVDHQCGVSPPPVGDRVEGRPLHGGAAGASRDRDGLDGHVDAERRDAEGLRRDENPPRAAADVDDGAVRWPADQVIGRRFVEG